MPDARLVAAASVALSVTLVAIFTLRPIAQKIGLVDRPDERKCHRGRVPLIGGLCFYLGMVAGLSYLGILDGFVVTLLVASALIMLTGLLDDLYQLSVRSRLAIQIGTTLAVMTATGVYIDGLGHVAGTELRLGVAGLLLTAIAVVGLINAFNMMDGIDGLAGGLAMVSILAFLGLSVGTGWQALGVLMLLQVLLVAMVPYLGVNLGWPDGRRIFMGDAGSTVIGFLLAWSAIYLSQRHIGRIDPVDVLWCIAIPVMDTIAVMVRRLKAGRSPFKPDRQHLHHLLLDAGCAPRAVLALVLGAGGLLAMVGYLLRAVPDLLNAGIFTMLTLLYVVRLPVLLDWLGEVREVRFFGGGAMAATVGEVSVPQHQAMLSDEVATSPVSRSAEQVRTLCVLGESRDAIRMAPVARQLRLDGRFDTHVCVADPDLDEQRVILELFDLKADIDLKIPADADANDITSATLDGIRQVLADLSPDVVLVYGDTPATLATTLAACYQEIPVARLESAAEWMQSAPMAIGDRINRRITSTLASFNFIPSESCGEGLMEAGVPRERIRVTGDPAVEALRIAIERIRTDKALEDSLRQRFGFLRAGSPLILVTHREDIAGFAHLGRALRKVAKLRPDVDIVYPIAMSSDAQLGTQRLGWKPANVHLIEPLDYLAFAYLMQQAKVVLTGSAEVQGEAGSLSKPVLVLRDAGPTRSDDSHSVRVDESAIAEGVMTLLNDPFAYEAMRADHAVFDGDAGLPSVRIVDALAAIPSRRPALAA